MIPAVRRIIFHQPKPRAKNKLHRRTTLRHRHASNDSLHHVCISTNIATHAFARAIGMSIERDPLDAR